MLAKSIIPETVPILNESTGHALVVESDSDVTPVDLFESESERSSAGRLATQCSDDGFVECESSQWCFCGLTRDWIDAVRNIHLECFPVVYSDAFYELLLKKDVYSTVLLCALKTGAKLRLADASNYDLAAVCTWKSQAPHSYYIATFGVTAHFRRRGLGSKLLRHVMDLIRDRDSAPVALRLSLHVLETNTGAIGLYQKFGFAITQRLIDHYSFNDKKHTALFMEREFGHSDCHSVEVDNVSGSQPTTEATVETEHSSDDSSHSLFSGFCIVL